MKIKFTQSEKNWIIQGGPERMQQLPIINITDIVNKTDLCSILLGRKFFFQQNDIMTINFGWGIWILGLF